MKKLESSLKNMLLVLTGVTAISVALLAYVNELTKGPIAEANAKTLNEALKEVLALRQYVRIWVRLSKLLPLQKRLKR